MSWNSFLLDDVPANEIEEFIIAEFIVPLATLHEWPEMLVMVKSSDHQGFQLSPNRQKGGYSPSCLYTTIHQERSNSMCDLHYQSSRTEDHPLPLF